MVIFYHKLLQLYIAFLNNPKCGSTTMSHYYTIIEKNLDKVFQSTIDVTPSSLSGYSDCNYNHCNLAGAINYLKNTNYVTVTTIRHPVEKLKSAYFFNSKNFGLNIDFESYVRHDFNLNQYTPRKFRYFENNTVTHLLKLENLHNELNELLKLYQINVALDYVRLNICEKSDMKISEDLHQFIKDAYKEDFEHYGTT